MYCQHCGEEMPEKAKTCPSCEGEQSRQETESSLTNRKLVGFSDRINDPRIAAVMKKINSSGMVFTYILAVVAVLGFTVVGAAEVGGFELPSAAYMGLAIGGLLVVIGFFQRAGAKKDKTWDGTIVDKKTKEASYSERRQGDYQTQYLLYIRRDDGKTKKISCTKEYFDYIRICERVRHHAGTADYILEKYDKSRDSIIFCIACTSKNDIKNDLCYRCKCPLLK